MRSSSLRVLTVAHNAVAASNRARTDALRRLPGVEVTLLTPPWWFEEGRRLEAHGAGNDWRVGRTVFTGNGTRHLYTSGLIEAIRAVKPDVIDLYEEPFSLVALQTIMARDVLAPNAALVFYSAVNVFRRWRWPYRGIERLVLRRAEAAHAPNADVPRILRTKGFPSVRPISIIPLGVDVARFAAARPMDLDAVPRPRIGFVGRIEPVKGLDVLIDAFHKLNIDASLVVAGDGSEKWRLTGNWVHLRAPVKYEDLPGLLKALDVLVLPSITILPMHREQFGRALAEGMAAGLPVIGSSSGSIPEVVGDAGLIVPERDPAALAAAIESVLTDAELRRSLVEKGRQRCIARFDLPRIVEQTLELFHSAVAQRRGVAHRQAVVA